jgi:DNA-binding CsgD family transcriptional regulator
MTDPAVIDRKTRMVVHGRRRITYGQALTPTELAILQGVSEGERYKVIANRLGVNVRTIHTHTRHVIIKFGAVTIVHAMAIAFRRGILK